MTNKSNQDFNDIRNSSTVGLALGAIVFLGLGCSLVFSTIYNCHRIIFGYEATETFGEWLLGIIVSLVMFISGLMFIVVGALCFYHFRLRRKLKRELRERMSKDDHLA
jgi:heme/copper-type cytochrome/quinol oxidase subunit 2